MTFPFVVVDHMANNQRTYQWVNGRIHDVGSCLAIDPPEAAPRPTFKKKPVMGIQTGLFLFTCSSLILVFAVPALIFVLFVIYSVVFG
ncbi:hypothetical protein CUN61_15995 [Pseudomonas arsenicoxydans]|uniref:Uncharacterized protein n=2 Tax=Pseudomonas arsenicoxydans TaxID=702115 RepID=A0A4P6G785_9PSED|nr:hypothetical protein CUN61_15995 [Pseudomonas arsenicoxydans]